MALSAPSQGWSDERVESFIGNLLRRGVIVAATVGVIGGIYFLSADGRLPADRHHFQGEPAWLTSVSGVVSGALAFARLVHRAAWDFMLIATPIARVALSLIAFAKQRDVTYVIITAIVLALLLFGLLGGGA